MSKSNSMGQEPLTPLQAMAHQTEKETRLMLCGSAGDSDSITLEMKGFAGLIILEAVIPLIVFSAAPLPYLIGSMALPLVLNIGVAIFHSHFFEMPEYAEEITARAEALRSPLTAFWDENAAKISELDIILGHRVSGDSTGRHHNIGMVKAGQRFQVAFQQAQEIVESFELDKKQLWEQHQLELAVLDQPVSGPKPTMRNEDNAGELVKHAVIQAQNRAEQQQQCELTYANAVNFLQEQYQVKLYPVQFEMEQARKDHRSAYQDWLTKNGYTEADYPYVGLE
jgi:hypothetical protein